MTSFQAIHDTEKNMLHAQARGMIRTPKFAGKTYSEVKAERRRFKVKVYQAILIGVGVLAAVAVALKAWVG